MCVHQKGKTIDFGDHFIPHEVLAVKTDTDTLTKETKGA